MSPQAVQFDEYGPSTVLHLTQVPLPHPGPGQVLVAVRAAAINPIDAGRRSGALRQTFPVTFPGTQGSDLAGVVHSIGPGVDAWQAGDEVIGWTRSWSAQASHVLMPADQLIPRPTEIDWPVAGSLFMVGATATGLVERSAAVAGETVLVSAAAGGVGSVVVQLLRERGAEVVAVASDANADWLRSLGAVPVRYGEGLADRVRAATGPAGRLDALIDLHGPEYLDLGLVLDVPPQRMVTATAFTRAQEIGAAIAGAADASSTAMLTGIAERVADGRLQIRVAATYPLDQVVAAMDRLASGSAGKIVLTAG
ncbi:MAG TPA: NADP-dependent oxidoreductase [Cellulomonas sp.]